MTVSRYQLHAEIRRVFVRRWIDLERIHFGAHRGIVRVSGELHYTRLPDRDVALSIIELLQQEILRIVGVTRVQFDLENWERDDSGRWQPVRSANPRTVDESEQRQVAVQAPEPAGDEDDEG